MNKNIYTFSLVLSSLIFLIQCEHPTEFKRNNNQDPISIYFGVEIAGLKKNQILSGQHSIIIEPADSSLQYINVLKTVEVFINDSLITTSNKVPLSVEINTDILKYGFYNIKCKTYTTYNREKEVSLQFYHGPFEQQKKTLIEGNKVHIEWDFGKNFSEYILKTSVNEDMTNPMQVVVLKDSLISKYIVELQRLVNKYYFQITAINDTNDSIKSNIQGVSKSFVNTAHINDGGSAKDVAVGSEGNIYLANGNDGLQVYSYDGSVFINTAHINDGGEAKGIAIGSNGIICLANGGGGLRTYAFNGLQLTSTAHVNDGGEAKNVAIGNDGKIFLANGSDGLRVYSFDGSHLLNTIHIENGGYVMGVAIGSDGYIYLANGHIGLFVYSYDGQQLTNTAKINNGGYAMNVAIGSEGTVFLANDDELRVYSYDGLQLTNMVQTDNGGSVVDITVGSDSTIYTTNYYDGLRAYIYNGFQLINMAQIDNGGNAGGVALGKNGTIFLANGNDGLRAYEYKWIVL